jgi:glycosyltransferase involved in cell wall biosynthesis
MIRLYGPSIGNGSWARVARGMAGALKALGRLEGFVPTDAYDYEAPYAGTEADIGVYVGAPPGARIMTEIGVHKERIVLLAPNSTWVPAPIVREFERVATGIATPSAWGASVLRSHFGAMPVTVWPHGVEEAFVPPRGDESLSARAAEYERGEFSVLHMASTTMQRKGTRELVMAWASAVRDRRLGKTPVLRLLVDGPSVLVHEMIDDACRGDPALVRTVAHVRSRANAPADAMGDLYRQHHVVCQPSRGEGFGMVGLEALASGVPVVATDCTGHSEWLGRGMDGAVRVHTGPDEPVDDGPDARAPSLRTEDVREALVTAYENWRVLVHDARSSARDVASRWSWAEVTRKWLAARA